MSAFNDRHTNRGFKNPRGRGALNPRVRKVEDTRGTPLDPRTQAPVPKADGLLNAKVYPPMPPTWPKSEGEWICYWYLKYHRHFVEDLDFYFDARVHVQALLRGAPLTQVDFLIDLGPTSPVGEIGWWKAIVLDPYTDFTHTFQYDKDRRDALNERGYLVIFLYEPRLKEEPIYLLDEALRGRDHSDRGAIGDPLL